MEEEGRVSICVPPKNALLLMRCRSDPLRMAALTNNRSWESPATKYDNDDEYEEDEQIDHGNEQEEEIIEKEESLEVVLETEHEEEEKFEGLVINEADEEYGVSEDTAILVMEVNDQEEITEFNHSQEEITECLEEEGVEVNETIATELTSNSSPEAHVDPENHEIEENKAELNQEDDDEYEGDDARRAIHDSSVSPLCIKSEKEEENHDMEAEEETEESTLEKETTERLSEDEETVTHQSSEPDSHESSVQEEELGRESYQPAILVRESRSTTLPDCLLLMMCEPKLSMEVSKETWVCSTDFIRCVPSENRKVNKSDGRDEHKKRVSVDSNPGPPTQNLLLQPPRSSCSIPAASTAAAHGVSMATMIEQKLGNSVAYEPFMLTRCKSAPIRTSGKFAKPETCFWKNKKLEQHRGAALGVGAAGVGF